MSDDIKLKTTGILLELLEVFHEEIIANRSQIVGIQEAQYRLLFHLKKNGPKSMSVLGDSLFFTKAYMTKLVDALTRDGFVERRNDPTDRRMIKIYITDAGLKKMEEGNLSMQKFILGKISGVPNNDIEDFYYSIKRILELFYKYNK